MTPTTPALRPHHTIPQVIAVLNRAAARKDASLPEHLERMAAIALAIAWRCEVAEPVRTWLGLAAPLLDIGKVAIADEILQKPARLTAAEVAVMRSHAQLGHDLLSSFASPPMRLAAEIALTHHEWWDGSGYPRRLRGEAIPLAGRIVAVADAIDTLVTHRPYRPALTIDAAFRALRFGSGSQFDPAVVRCTLACENAIRELFQPRALAA